MKILIIGGGGMLGHKLVQAWSEKFDVWATLRRGYDAYEKYNIFDENKIFDSLDVKNTGDVNAVVGKVKPDVIINAAGIIKQVPISKNIIETLSVNAVFPHQLAEIAENHAARLINVSTDCVFNGEKGGYTEEDTPDAFDLYGKSKNLGEVVKDNCLTLRTSIIGRELHTAHSLVEWFLSSRGKQVRGFVNAIYTGFPTVYLAEILHNIIINFPNLAGLYHVAGDPINKFELLKLIRQAYKIEVEIEKFEDFKIDRSLDSEKFRQAVKFRPPDWKKLIAEMANDPTPYDSWR